MSMAQTRICWQHLSLDKAAGSFCGHLARLTAREYIYSLLSVSLNMFDYFGAGARRSIPTSISTLCAHLLVRD
jgi:hypothetical protein